MLTMNQIEKINILASAQENIRQTLRNNASGRYYLSNQEWEDLPKFSPWQVQFAGDIIARLDCYGDKMFLSEKQEAQVDKLLTKIRKSKTHLGFMVNNMLSIMESSKAA